MAESLFLKVGLTGIDVGGYKSPREALVATDSIKEACKYFPDTPLEEMEALFARICQLRETDGVFE